MDGQNTKQRRAISFLVGLIGCAVILALVVVFVQAHSAQSQYQIVFHGKSYANLYAAILTPIIGIALIMRIASSWKFAFSGIATATAIIITAAALYVIITTNNDKKNFIQTELLVTSNESFGQDGQSDMLNLSIKNNSDKTVNDVRYLISLMSNNDTVHQFGIYDQTPLYPNSTNRISLNAAKDLAKTDVNNLTFSISISCAHVNQGRCIRKYEQQNN